MGQLSTRASSRRADGRAAASSARTWTRCRRPPRSSRSSRTASSATPPGRSSAPTTRPRSPRCSRRRAASSPSAARTPGSSCSSRRRRRSGWSGAYAFDHSAAAGADGLRLRPGGADRRRDPRRAVLAVARGDVPRPRRACGHAPEDGRSAIAAAARAISEFRLGRVDEDSTANVGTISGGTATNIVPEWCTFVAEARSQDERKLADLIQEMQDAITFAAGVAECDVETKARKSYRGYRFAKDDRAVALAAGALERAAATTVTLRAARAAPRTRTSSTSAASSASTSRTA